MVNSQLLSILSKFESLKQSKVTSVNDFVNVAKQIQSLANLLTGVLHPDFLEVAEKTSFYENYKSLIFKAKEIASKGYEYKLSESSVSLYKGEKKVAKHPVMAVTELVSFLSEEEDITSPEVFQLLELYLSQETNFALLNFSLAYIKSELVD